MVIAGALGDPIQSSEILEDVAAHRRMCLDDPAFLLSQPPLLVQDVIRHTDLPDIMEQSHIVDTLLFFRREAHTPGDLPGIPGHPEGVAVCIAVFGIDGLGKGLEGLVYDLLIFPLPPAQLGQFGPRIDRNRSGCHRNQSYHDQQPEHWAFGDILVLADLRLTG